LILNDEKIKQYIALGCEVKGLGRGHIKRLKEEVQTKEKGKRKKVKVEEIKSEDISKK
jgi:UDP-N-acetyl-D-glucosamine dehydrogenase